MSAEDGFFVSWQAEAGRCGGSWFESSRAAIERFNSLVREAGRQQITLVALEGTWMGSPTSRMWRAAPDRGD